MNITQVEAQWTPLYREETVSDNLIEALEKEITRNKRLIEIYESIGPAGAFAKMMISQDVTNAEAALADVDTVAMIRTLAALRGNKE